MTDTVNRYSFVAKVGPQSLSFAISLMPQQCELENVLRKSQGAFQGLSGHIILWKSNTSFCLLPLQDNYNESGFQVMLTPSKPWKYKNEEKWNFFAVHVLPQYNKTFKRTGLKL
jgi:hypothetical protein